MNKYYSILKTVALFNGIDEADYESLLSCLQAKINHYDKNESVIRQGEKAENVGILLKGQAQVIKEDYYGNRSLMTHLEAGMLFGETFACADITAFPVSVFTTADSEILFINFIKMAVTCSNSCRFHSRMLQNMLQILASKNIMLNQKIEFISKRTTKEKLLSYLSFEAQKAGNSHFVIPYNRQELADFLSVDRSAMSAELSKLRNDGVIQFHKNEFRLLSINPSINPS